MALERIWVNDNVNMIQNMRRMQGPATMSSDSRTLDMQNPGRNVGRCATVRPRCGAQYSRQRNGFRPVLDPANPRTAIRP